MTPTLTPAPVMPVARACGPWMTASPCERKPPVDVPPRSAATIARGRAERGRLRKRSRRDDSLDHPLGRPVARRGDPHAEGAESALGGAERAVHVDVDRDVAVRRGRHVLPPRGDDGVRDGAAAESARRDVLQVVVELAKVAEASRIHVCGTPPGGLHELRERRAGAGTRTNGGGHARAPATRRRRAARRSRWPPLSACVRDPFVRQRFVDPPRTMLLRVAGAPARSCVRRQDAATAGAGGGGGSAESGRRAACAGSAPPPRAARGARSRAPPRLRGCRGSARRGLRRQPPRAASPATRRRCACRATSSCRGSAGRLRSRARSPSRCASSRRDSRRAQWPTAPSPPQPARPCPRAGRAC